MTSQATNLDEDRATLLQSARQDSPTPHTHTPDNAQDNDLVSNPPSDQSTPSLAQAIMLMTAELRRQDSPPKSTGSKVKEPDTFDGSDPKKLNNFILLCTLYFRNNFAYSEDNSKIMFALTYLRGTALEFFEPLLTSDADLPWENDWQEFVRILRAQFGPFDPTADAEDSIDNLKMKDNQQILKYNVEFNRLAVQTGWNNTVLRHRYYSGLAERIKDAISQLGKPSTLGDMKTLAHSIDARHWERIREKSRSDSLKTNPSDNKSDKRNSNASDISDTSDNSDTSDTSDISDIYDIFDHTDQSQRTITSKSKSESTANPIFDKLGKDGKLTPQERQHRFDNGLCMICGASGHITDDCPKSAASRAKARASTISATEQHSDN